MCPCGSGPHVHTLRSISINKESNIKKALPSLYRMAQAKCSSTDIWVTCLDASGPPSSRIPSTADKDEMSLNFFNYLSVETLVNFTWHFELSTRYPSRFKRSR